MPEQNQNLAIWNKVRKTDPRYVKQATVGGRKTASINHLGMVEQATAIWGPIGLHWGYQIVEERDDQCEPILLDGQVIGHNITHTIRLKVWYEQDGKRAEVENYGHTPRIYWSRKNGYFISDEEAPKKSVSDALKKCLSFLGFSADIYGGEWDNPEYQRERQMEAQVEQAEDKDNERDHQVAELVEYVKRHLATIEKAQQLNEAAGAFKVAVRHLERQKTFPHLRAAAEKGTASIGRAYDDKKTQLEKDAK